MDGFTVQLRGVEELKTALAGAAKEIRTKAVRGALREAGKVIQAAARANAPVLKTPNQYRKPGTVKKAISVRRSKVSSKGGNEGVYISVRPLRGARTKKLGKASATNPNDPYYWWFLEFGTKPHMIKGRNGKKLAFGGKVRSFVNHPGVKPMRFMTRAANTHGQAAVHKFMTSVVPQIEKLNKKAIRRVR